jgi:hypothetical protein
MSKLDKINQLVRSAVELQQQANAISQSDTVSLF